jgi:hypothetical protein
VRQPAHAKVFVIVNDREQGPSFHAGSPHLAQPECRTGPVLARSGGLPFTFGAARDVHPAWLSAR